MNYVLTKGLPIINMQRRISFIMQKLAPYATWGIIHQ
jgi:hypothetical protein